MNDRIAFLRERALTSRYVGDPDWKRLREESLAQTEGQPPVLREAEALAHYWRHRPIAIHERELIVGSRAGLVYGAEPSKPHSFGRQPFAPPWPMAEHVALLFREGVLSPAGNHTTLDYDAILSGGFEGLLARLERRKARLAPDVAASVPLADPATSEPGVATADVAASVSLADSPTREARVAATGDEPLAFLDGLRIVAKGYIALCHRYAELAEALAREAADATRRSDLLTIARSCRRVVAQPPRTFWEACQALWFAFFFSPDAPGRVDLYLAPFYERDIAAGTLTRDFAKELLACFWLKVFEWMGAQAAVAAHQHLTLGGVRPDGSDASSEVTWLCLEVTEELRIQRPQVGFRWHRGTPPDLLRRAVRTLRSQGGSPDFCSDEQIVPALVRLGIAPEDARDFSLSGCHEVIVTGKAQMGAVEGFINLPKLLRAVLGLEPALPVARGSAASPCHSEPVEEPLKGANRSAGADSAAGAPLSERCFDKLSMTRAEGVAPSGASGPAECGLASLDSFERLYAAVEEAMEFAAAGAHEYSLDRDRRQADIPGGILTASLVTNDCVERCRGYTQGGARYNFCNWDAIGIVNLADSLAAIGHLVYDEEALTLAELAEILRANWEGHEPFRRRVLNKLPHFGNDDAEADALAARIIASLTAILRRRTPFRGGLYTLGTLAGGENMHVEFGRVTGATPDGRRAGEPLADSLAAAQGRDRRGLTAMLNSVAGLPHHLLPTSTTVNVKLDPKLVESEAGIEKVAALIEAHFRSGGQQLQFNFYNREILLEARRCPEKHAGLMVRVAGYSAPFISLWGDLQDEIIARTEHGV